MDNSDFTAGYNLHSIIMNAFINKATRYNNAYYIYTIITT